MRGGPEQFVVVSCTAVAVPPWERRYICPNCPKTLGARGRRVGGVRGGKSKGFVFVVFVE